MPQQDSTHLAADIERLKAESHEELDRLHEEAKDQTPEEAIRRSDEIHEEVKASIVRDAEKFASVGAENPYYHPLTAHHVSRVLFDLPDQTQVQLVVRIGSKQGGEGGRDYIAMDGDLEVTEDGRLVLNVPDSVAEAFRQQGRRKKTQEIHRALGLG